MSSFPSSPSSLRVVGWLSLTLFAALACGEGANSGGGGSVNVPPTDPVPPACNGDQPDGFCNIEGVETCACFDCVDSALCTSLCADDGTCTEQELTIGGCFCDDCKEACMMGNGGGPSSGGSPGNGGNGTGAMGGAGAAGAGGPGGAGGAGAAGAAGGAGGAGAAGGAGGAGGTGGV
jgi:hypothetical protein